MPNSTRTSRQAGPVVWKMVPISRDYSSGPCSSDPQPDRRNHGMVATFEEVASETARQTRREFSLA